MTKSCKLGDMNRLWSTIIIIAALSLVSCGTNTSRLAEVEDKHPKTKINKKIYDDLNTLDSIDAKERAWAAYNIGKARGANHKAVPYLIAILNDVEETTLDRYVGSSFVNSYATTPADEAVKALVKIGSPAVKPLITALESKDKLVVTKSIKALGLIRDKQAIKPLLLKLGDKDAHTRLAAANALGKFKGPWVAGALLTALRHENVHTRASAAYALGNIRDPIALQPLTARLEDSDVSVQSQAAIAITKYGYDRAIPILLKVLKTSRKVDKAELIYNLGSLRDYRVIETLIPLVEANDTAIRQAAVASLQQISGQQIGADKKHWQRWWKNKIKRTREAAKN